MTRKFLADLAERAIATYAETLIGLLLASATGAHQVADMSSVAKLALAAVPAALSVVKSGLATLHGSTDSASLVD